MSETRYAVYCKNCGHLEDKAWTPATNETHSTRTATPLTPQGQVPIYCQQCGKREWEKPASKEHVEKYDARAKLEARAVELTKIDDFDGLFKIPDEVRAAPEIKRALSNLLAPLEGETLKQAQANILKVARSGMAADSMTWIDYYDRAVAKALPKKVAA